DTLPAAPEGRGVEDRRPRLLRGGVGAPARAPAVSPIALFTAAIALGAALVMVVQPMSAKAVLPALGGTPAVWNASMLFFQAALLLGYLLAHGLDRLARPRSQVLTHAVLL